MPEDCLALILQALASPANQTVVINESTLAIRAGAALNELRPDLDLRKQAAHWAASNGLLCRHNPATRQFTFSRLT